MTLDDAKTFGIIGGLIISSVALFLNFFSTIRSIRGQKISNYQEIIKSHRDIWKLTLQDPTSYGRLFELDVDVSTSPITQQERTFSQLLFLHMTAAYTFLKYSHMQPIEKLEMDFYEVLLAPIPRLVWSESRKYYNSDFRFFVEKANKRRGIRRMIGKFTSDVQPDYTKPWNVLLLTAFPDNLRPVIERLGDVAICMTDADEVITKSFIKSNNINFVVCFGYGKMVRKEVFSRVPCINIHGGYLPWNRGPNPNLWAWIDDTKKGISIHYIDSGVDTGDLIAQKEIQFEPPITLESTFDTTVKKCKELFSEEWPKIRAGTAARFPQSSGGSIYTFKSQQPLDNLLDEGGLDMPIEQFRETALKLLNRNKIG